MPAIVLKLEEPAWPELADKPIVHLGNDAPAIQVAYLEGGMASGKPSVALRLDLPDGTIVVAETSFELFAAAARGMEARRNR
jgi:hypothetical protein